MRKSMIIAVIAAVATGSPGCAAEKLFVEKTKSRKGVEAAARSDDSAVSGCKRKASLQVRNRKGYDDRYGTIITSDKGVLKSPDKTFKWGITNNRPLSMSYFAAYLKPAGKYGNFQTSIYIDESIKAPLTFDIRNGSYDGEVIKSVTVSPGETESIEVDVQGVKKLFIGTELRINHDSAEKIIIGEPEFYSCAP